MRTTLKNHAIPDGLWQAARKVAQQDRVDVKDQRALLSVAASQGDISEEEVRLIASLADPASRRSVARATGKAAPDRLELTLDRATLDRLRQEALQSGHPSPVEQRVKQDPQVVRLLDVLNDRDLAPADLRSVLQRECRVSLRQLGPRGARNLLAEGLLTRRGGISEPLGKRLETDVALRTTLNQLLGYLFDPNSDKRIESVWRCARNFAGQAGPGDPTERALAAMAILCSEEHMEQFLAKVPEAQAQYRAIVGGATMLQQQSESEVFSHGVGPANPNATGVGQARSDFTADHDRHFFSHAYLGYELSRRGWEPDRAHAASSVAGMVYELYGGGMAENGGNDSIHDALKNRYGAEWGTDLARDSQTPLPRPQEGPPVEDRGRPNAPAEGKARRIWDTLLGL